MIRQYARYRDSALARLARRDAGSTLVTAEGTPMRVGDADDGSEGVAGRPLAYWLDSTPPTDYPPLRQEPGRGGVRRRRRHRRHHDGVPADAGGRQGGGGGGRAHRAAHHRPHHRQDHVPARPPLRPADQARRAGARAALRRRAAGRDRAYRVVGGPLGIACDFRRTEAYTYTESEQDLPAIHAEVDARARTRPAGVVH